MKKIIALLMAGLMISFACASCKKEEGTDDETTITESVAQEEPEETKKLDIVVDGKSDYVIVVDFDQATEKGFATEIMGAIKRATGVALEIKDSNSDDTYEHEIAIGKSRDYSRKIGRSLTGRDFIYTVVEDDLVFFATDTEMYRYMTLMAIAELIDQVEEKVLSVSVDTKYRFGALTATDARYVSAYRQINGTYGSYAQEWFATKAPDSVKNDQRLIDAMIERMGGSAVVMDKKSNVLYNGRIEQLDYSDYSKTASVDSSGNVLIPKAFADEYFDDDITANAQGLVDVTKYIKDNDGYDLHCDSQNKLAIITPDGVESFEKATKSVNGYTNKKYIERMVKFFEDFVEVDTDAETTRTLIEDCSKTYDPDTALDYKTQERLSTLSPSFLITTQNGSTVMYASYEYRHLKDFCSATDSLSRIKKSTDGGKTWTLVDEIQGFVFGELFDINGQVYIIGRKSGTVQIVKVNPNGGSTVHNLGFVFNTCDIADVSGPNPTNTLIHNGRLYFTCDVYVMSVDITKNVTVGSNWTISNNIRSVVTNEYINNETGLEKNFSWMEGNVVLGPDGKTVYMIYRFNPGTASYNEHILILKLGEDNKTVSAVKVASCPTTSNKFTIHYDPQTKLYMMLTSEYRSEVQATANERTNVVLLVSSDLFTWKKAADIISDRSLMNSWNQAWSHGWQYVDWQILGDDIYMVVREADDMGCSYHDGTYTSFYKIEDFRELI